MYLLDYYLIKIPHCSDENNYLCKTFYSFDEKNHYLTVKVE